jgi:hypothetical protein
LGLSHTPWSERYKKDYLETKAREKKFKDSVKATQVKNTVPSHTLSSYTGKFSNPMYGEVTIELQNGQLVLLFRKQSSVLHHYHYDQFITKEPENRPDFPLNFLTNSKGEIDRITVNPFGDPMAEFVKTASPSVPLQ